MKYFLCFIISSFFGITLTYSQSLFSYQISRNSSTIDVVFIYNSSLGQSFTDKRVFTWNFGDGSSSVSQTKLPTDGSSLSILHTYYLNNSSIKSGDYLNVNVELTVTDYDWTNDHTYDGHYESVLKATFHDSQFINYYLGLQSTISLDFFPTTRFATYDVGMPIDFSFNIPPNNALGSSFLTYSISNIGYGTSSTGSISPPDDLGKDVKSTYSFTPQTAGIYTIEFKLLDGNNITLVSKQITVTVLSINDINPRIKVIYTITADKYEFTIAESSTTNFMNRYCTGGYTYDILYWNSRIIGGRSLKHATYFCPTTRAILSVPRYEVNDGSQVCKFEFMVSSIEPIANGGKEILSCYSQEIIVLPKVFNPKTENNYTVPQNGGRVSIETHSSSCKAIQYANTNKLNDNLKWVKNLDINSSSKLTFDVASNFDERDRELEIKMYVSPNYDKCLIDEFGVKRDYRLIKVHQPTILFQDDAPTQLPVVMPNLNNPNANITSYYAYEATAVMVVPPGTMMAGTYRTTHKDYVKNSTAMPYNFIANYPTMEGFSWENGHLLGYNSNNEVVYTKDFLISGTGANCSTKPFDKETAAASDIYSGTYLNNIEINDFSTKANQSIAISANSHIVLRTGFKAVGGSRFRATIAPCNTLKTTSPLDISSFFNDTIQTNMANPLNRIKVYPNPSKGTFNVDFSDCLNHIQGVQVYSMDGQLLISKSNVFEKAFVIDLSDRTSGIYLLKVIDDKSNVVVKKMVKN